MIDFCGIELEHRIVNAGKESTTQQLRVTDLTQQVAAARARATCVVISGMCATAAALNDSIALSSVPTASPSTTRRGWRLTSAPTAESSTLSTSMKSPTATLCWRPPLRTTAYTPDLLS